MQFFGRAAFCLLVIATTQGAMSQGFQYGASSQEALEKYKLGWEQILDLGEWTQAEESFRKSIELDPEFLMGWSQVGRISNDPKERMEIYQMLESKKTSLQGFERELLEVYLGSLKIIDYKDRGREVRQEMVSEFRDKLYFTSRDFLQVFPEETYIEAEYIESIEGKFGAAAALDSMQTRQIVQKSPFFKSYQVLCLSETGEFEKARIALAELQQIPGMRKSPAFFYTKGKLLFDQNKFVEAKKAIEMCLELDPKHTLARRIKASIDAL